MEPEDIAKTALRVFSAFLEHEDALLAVDINERSLTHKIAEYLQCAFPYWNVDCEYNRLGQDVKRLPSPQSNSTDDTEGRTIFPDIIVHRRCTEDNLLVIEVKKTTNSQLGDQEKLRALTNPNGRYVYTLGLHIVIDCRQHVIRNIVAFTQGSENHNLTKLVQLELQKQHSSGRSANDSQPP